MHATPTTLLADQLTFLDMQLPGIRDGDGEAIHHARVATRRIREILPLCLQASDTAADFRRTIRDIGRGLGRVRDVDVAIGLLEEVALRVPRAGSLLALRRHAAEETRLQRLRKLVKRLPDRFSSRGRHLLLRSPRAVIHDRVWPAAWRTALRDRIQTRREQAAGALLRAGGVYFPNRLHEARIAVKKLRYSAELAVATGVAAVDARTIRRLRKAQDALGDIHDWQLLLSALEETAGTDTDGHETVIMLLRSDIQAKHRRFLERADELLAACGSVQPSPPVLTTAALPAATAVAAAALWTLNRRGQ